MLGLQKGVSGLEQTSGGGGYSMQSGTGTGGGGGGGGGQQFAFHEPQPGTRRARATNGGVGGGMALDPRARVPVGRVAARVGGGRGGVGSPGTPMTAEEMERIVNGS